MNKFLLSLMALLCLNISFGQILTFDFDGLAGNEVSANSNFNAATLNASTITTVNLLKKRFAFHSAF